MRAMPAKKRFYRAQTFISTWVGDTKVREPRQGKPLIQPAQVSELRTKLKPGDVLLERRNWFLSNAFLPGYWPHSALYVARQTRCNGSASRAIRGSRSIGANSCSAMRRATST